MAKADSIGFVDALLEFYDYPKSAHPGAKAGAQMHPVLGGQRVEDVAADVDRMPASA